MKLKIQEAGIPTLNRRIYPKAVLEREVKKWSDGWIKENRAFVSKNPPEEGMTRLSDIACVIKKLYMEDNTLFAELEKLANDVNGSDMIWEMLIANKLHPRIAGIGTTELQPDGTFIVGDDFELTAIFLTDDPA